MTVLSLTPSTRAVAGSLKVTVAEALKLTGAKSLTVALRDNGEKVNATLVLVAGPTPAKGEVFGARSSKNNMAYGPHLVLGTVSADGADCDLDVSLDTKAALFLVGGEPKTETVLVKRAKDGEVVASNVSRAEAEAMVAKAKAGKKAALVIV